MYARSAISHGVRSDSVTGDEQCPRRARRAVLPPVALMVFVAALVLLAASPALAAGTLTFSSESPTMGAVVPPGAQTLKVNMAGSLAITASSHKVYVDGALVPARQCYLTFVAGTGNTAAASLSYANVTADGTHTASVTVKNSSGSSFTDTWTFRTGIAPVLGSPTPELGSTATTVTPLIQIPASDNHLVDHATAMVNGAPAVAMYSAATGKVTVAPATPLVNDAVTVVTVTAFDDTGLSATKSWSFYVQTKADMVSQVAQCTACHVGYGHADDMAPTCSNCHVGKHSQGPPAYHARANVGSCSPCHVSQITVEHAGRTTKTGALMQCVTCHNSTDPAVVAAIASGNTECSACHAVGSAHEALHATTVTPSCEGSGCHTGTSLTGIHLGSGSTLTCDSCHKSADPAVVAAIANHDTACTACHSSAIHTAQHDTPVVVACTGSACHSGTNLQAIHATSACAACHKSEDPKVIAAIAGHDKSCTACHDAVTPHPGQASAHVASAIGSGEITMGLDDGDHGSGMTINEDCTKCHITDLALQHANQCQYCHSNAGAPTLPGASWNKSCQQGGCHAAIHTGQTANHNGVYTGHSASCDACHDTQSGSFPGDGDNCNRCHDPAATIPDHQAPITTSDAVASYPGAATIALSPVDVGGSGVATTYYRVDWSGNQVGTTISIPAPTAAVAYHTVMFWSVDVAGNAESPKTVTVAVHGSGAADVTGPTGTMTVNNDAAYSLAAATVNSAMTDAESGLYAMSIDPGTGTYGSWIQYQAASAITLPAADGLKTVRVQYKDYAGNVTTKTRTITRDTTKPVTTSDIIASHVYVGAQTFTLTPTDGGSGVGATQYLLDSGSWQTGTSVAVPAPVSGTQSHTLYWYATDAVSNVETVKSVSFSSQVAVPDTTPPTTTSNFNPASGAVYKASQAVTLTATDNVGGSGVKTTYYRIDGGAFVAGTSFQVTGDGLHTFSWYSVDNANNTETTHVSNQFRIDTVAPVTTNTAVGGSTYTGAQTFTLAPSDTGGSGVATTMYKLDGGSWTSGTSVAVAAPSSGSAAHTISWYSTDVAGNQESTKTVTFTVAAASAAPVTLAFTGTTSSSNHAYKHFVVYDSVGTLVAESDWSTDEHTTSWSTSVPSGQQYTMYFEWELPDYEGGATGSDAHVVTAAQAAAGTTVSWVFEY